MSIRVILGRSGMGKTHFIQQEITRTLKDNPLGPPIIVIVPEQLSYAMEYELGASGNMKGLIRAEVLTFKRLAWRVLQQVGGITREEIDPFGYSMLIRKIVTEHQNELEMFKKSANQTGFIQSIVAILSEFDRYDVSSKQLQFVHQQAHQSTLQAKLNDLYLIQHHLEEALGTSYISQEGKLALLVEQVQASQFLKEATIYIDGFESFTVRELQLIQQLFMYSKNVTISLQYEHQKEDIDTFHTGMRSYQALLQILEENGQLLDEEVHLYQNYRTQSSNLIEIEKQFDERRPKPVNNDDAVHIFEAEDAEAEIDAIAREIIRLSKQGIAYREMAVYYRTSLTYERLFEQKMIEYEIPYFLSVKKSMLHHPLIEWTRSILEVIQKGWQFDPIMRAIKTGLFFDWSTMPDWHERVDELENHVITRGISGKRWFDEDSWTVFDYKGLDDIRTEQTVEEQEREARLKQIRDLVIHPLLSFEKQVKEAKDGRSFVAALYHFTEQLNVTEHLQLMQLAEQQEEALEKASTHEQVWEKWIHVLEQYDFLFGTEQFTLTLAIQVLNEGFEQLTYRLIPPSIDQVTITTYEKSSASNPKVTFAIGLNDGVLPARIDFEGLLSDEEREFFEAAGVPLAITTEEQLLKESHFAYRAFSSPKQKLYLSYRKVDQDGKVMIRSSYIDQIELIIPDVKTTVVTNDVKDVPLPLHPLYLVTKNKAFHHLLQMWREVDWQTHHLPELWKGVYEQLMQEPVYRKQWQQITDHLQGRNQDENISKELAVALYGATLQSSVSRVESYYRCPFQHFATYGLTLKERIPYTLNAPDLGDLFHAAMKWIHEELHQRGILWKDVDAALSQQLAFQALDYLAPYFVHNILLSSARFHYIHHKLTQLIQATVKALGQQANQSDFRVVKVEASFGTGQETDMPALSLQLNEHERMNIRGRIDRIDAYDTEKQTYIRIVDYKSSAQTLDLSKVFHGLSLQMLTYLNATLTHANYLFNKPVAPAGVLYFHMHNPVIDGDKEKQIERSKLKSYKMSGYILDHPSIAEAMDTEIASDGIIVPAKLKKNGEFYSNSKVLSEDSIRSLAAFTMIKHEEAGRKILSGDVRVQPTAYEGKLPCEFCSYRAVCQFDPTDPVYESKQALKYEDTEILQKMEGEVQ